MWLGDFAYFDDPLLNCDLVPSYSECNCTADFMRRPPFQCFAGVAEHARLRVQLQVCSLISSSVAWLQGMRWWFIASHLGVPNMSTLSQAGANRQWQRPASCTSPVTSQQSCMQPGGTTLPQAAVPELGLGSTDAAWCSSSSFSST